MRWRRFRKWAKWTCTLAAGAAVAVALFSRFYTLAFETTSQGGQTIWDASLGEGVLWMRKQPYVFIPHDEMGGGPSWFVLRFDGWTFSPEFGGLKGHAGVLWARGQSAFYLGVSLMYPVLLTSISAGLLWYADRRFGLGLCGGCGYDRRGLAADAKCPECGTMPVPGGDEETFAGWERKKPSAFFEPTEWRA